MSFRICHVIDDVLLHLIDLDPTPFLNAYVMANMQTMNGGSLENFHTTLDCSTRKFPFVCAVFG